MALVESGEDRAGGLAHARAALAALEKAGDPQGEAARMRSWLKEHE
jgi:hypothetical protein